MLTYRETAQRLKITDFALRHAVSRSKMTPIKNAKGDGIGFSESYVDNLLNFAAGKKIKPELIKKFELSPSGQKVLKEQLIKMEENKKEVPEPTEPVKDFSDSAQVKDLNPNSDEGGNENEVQTDSAVNAAVVKVMSQEEVADPNINTLDVTPPEMKALSKLEFEIKFYFEQISKNVFEIGKRLMQAKKMLKHGEWEKWLERNFELSDRTARRYMAIAEKFGKTDTVSEIDFSTFKTAKLITLLGLAEGREQEFFAQLKAAGKDIAKLSNPELAKDVKEFNAQVDAELAAKDKCIETLQSQLEETLKTVETVQAANQTLADNNDTLNKEIEELRNRPSETVTVEIPVEKVPVDYQSTKDNNVELEATVKNQKTEIENLKKQLAASENRKSLKEALGKFQIAYDEFVRLAKTYCTPEASKIRAEIFPLWTEGFDKANFYLENGVAPALVDPNQINLNFDDDDNGGEN